MVRGVIMLAMALAVCGACSDGGVAVRVPPGFPADVPLPERALLRTARDQDHRGITLVYETAESPAAAGGRLRERLSAGGWEQLSEATVDGGVFTSFRRSGASVALGVSRTGDVTVIGISYRRALPPEEGEQG